MFWVVWTSIKPNATCLGVFTLKVDADRFAAQEHDKGIMAPYVFEWDTSRHGPFASTAGPPQP